MLACWVRTLCVCAVILLCHTVAGRAIHGHDDNVCTSMETTDNPNDPQMPDIPEQFRARVEVVIVNKNRTDVFTEYYDGPNKRGYIKEVSTAITNDMWYDYNIGQFIGYYPQLRNAPGSCYAANLNPGSNRYFFGRQTMDGRPQTAYSLSGALEFAKTVYNQYMGETTVRNINVDWWRSCTYWQVMDATMVIDWYFTSDSSWYSAAGNNIRVPVQAHIRGTGYNATAGHYFEHFYNIFDFKPSIDDNTTFETPDGVFCPGRKLTKPLPNLPIDAFVMSLEIVDHELNKVSYIKESYYEPGQLTMFEYRAQAQEKFGNSDLVHIQDFHSGLAYIRDAVRGNCTTMAVPQSGFGSVKAGPNTVRMRTANEFFYLNNVNVSYTGVKKRRGVDCDSWVARRHDFPDPDNLANSTWEWLFATDDWQQKIPEDRSTGALPIQMTFHMPDLPMNYEYNIFNFQTGPPDIFKFNVRGCYPGEHRTIQFYVTVTPTESAEINSHLELFKYTVLLAVESYVNISPIRISQLEVSFINDDIVVSFDLLAPPPVLSGNQNKTDYHPVSVDSAAATINQLLQKGQFVISGLDGTQFQGMPFTTPPPPPTTEPATTSSSRDTTSSSDIPQSGGTVASLTSPSATTASITSPNTATPSVSPGATSLTTSPSGGTSSRWSSSSSGASATESPRSAATKDSTAVIVGSVLGVLLAGALVLSTVFIWKWRKSNQRLMRQPGFSNDAFDLPSVR